MLTKSRLHTSRAESGKYCYYKRNDDESDDKYSKIEPLLIMVTPRDIGLRAFKECRII